MGRIAVGNKICLNIFIFKKYWIRITYFLFLCSTSCDIRSKTGNSEVE
jgi:hypothetical protein